MTTTEPEVQQSDTTAVSGTVAAPGAPYSQEQLDELAYGLSKAAPYFLGADVRSEESSKTVAKTVLDTLVSVGFSFPEMSDEARTQKEESEDPEKASKAAEKSLKEAQAAESASSSSSSSEPSSSGKSTVSTSSKSSA